MATYARSTPASCCSVLFSCLHSIICWIFTIIVLIVLVIVLYVLLKGSKEAVEQSLSVPTNAFVSSDKPGRHETLLWREPSGQGGLQLEVLNALDDTWTPYFEEYIQKWDAGYENDTKRIDPLSLSVQRVAVDPDCEPVAGKLKACNSDYGETDWRGITIALVDQGNYIQNSISKYNDYFLSADDMQNNDNQMKYTMCHELGHGWGFAHTDEDYFNSTTGGCMDYTQFPGRNLDCGEFNFNLLHELYGNSERRLRKRALRPQFRTLSEETMQEYRAAVEHASQGRSCADCTLDLSQGYRVYVHKLLA